MLSIEQLQQLRKDIYLGSLYLEDYQNTLGINEQKVYDFFCGYEEHLTDKAKYYNNLFRNRIRRKKLGYVAFDSIHELWSYYCMFVEDPLPIE